MTKRGNGEGNISRHPARDLWMARWTEVVNGEVKRRTLYAVLAYSGLRISEALSLRCRTGTRPRRCT